MSTLFFHNTDSSVKHRSMHHLVKVKLVISLFSHQKEKDVTE